MGKIMIAIKKAEEFNSVDVVEINNDLEEMQKIVGGYLENVALKKLMDEGILLFVNEEGKFDSENKVNILLSYRGQIQDEIVGNVIFTGIKDGDISSLTQEQVRFIKNNLFAKEFAVLDDRAINIIKI